MQLLLKSRRLHMLVLGRRLMRRRLVRWRLMRRRLMRWRLKQRLTSTERSLSEARSMPITTVPAQAPVPSPSASPSPTLRDEAVVMAGDPVASMPAGTNTTPGPAADDPVADAAVSEGRLI